MKMESRCFIAAAVCRSARASYTRRISQASFCRLPRYAPHVELSGVGSEFDVETGSIANYLSKHLSFPNDEPIGTEAQK
jgi:hypothetical protein